MSYNRQSDQDILRRLEAEGVGRDPAQAYINSMTVFANEIARLLKIQYQGGNVYDVMKELVEVQNEMVELSQDDVSRQKNILAQDLQMTGYFTDKEIEQKIKIWEDEGDLYSKATDVANRMNEEYRRKNEFAFKRQEEEQRLRQERFSQHVGTLEQIINQKQLGDFRIPDNEVDSFKNYLNEGFQDGRLHMSDDGSIYAVRPLTSIDQLQAEFLSYRQGNISDLVNMKAMSMNVARTLKTAKNQAKRSSGRDPQTIQELISSLNKKR